MELLFPLQVLWKDRQSREVLVEVAAEWADPKHFPVRCLCLKVSDGEECCCCYSEKYWKNTNVKHVLKKM